MIVKRHSHGFWNKNLRFSTLDHSEKEGLENHPFSWMYCTKAMFLKGCKTSCLRNLHVFRLISRISDHRFAYIYTVFSMVFRIFSKKTKFSKNKKMQFCMEIMVEEEGTRIFEVVFGEAKRRWMLVNNDSKLSYAVFLGQVPDHGIAPKPCK